MKAQRIDLSRGDVEFDSTLPFGFRIGWGGYITVTLAGDGRVYRVNGLKKGALLTIAVSRIHKRGTSCRKIYALWFGPPG